MKKIMLLIILCGACLLAFSGVFRELHDVYENIRGKYYSMYDNIGTSGISVRKNMDFSEEICTKPEDAIFFINNLCKSNGLEIRKLRFCREVSLSSELELGCRYEGLLKFIDDVKAEGFNAVVSSVNTFELGDGSIDAVVVLSFYDVGEGEDIDEK